MIGIDKFCRFKWANQKHGDHSVRMLHNYNTRLSSKMTYVIHKSDQIISGTFNIRFQGANVWNDISDDKKLHPLKIFKKNLKLILLEKC